MQVMIKRRKKIPDDNYLRTVFFAALPHLTAALVFKPNRSHRVASQRHRQHRHYETTATFTVTDLRNTESTTRGERPGIVPYLL